MIQCQNGHTKWYNAKINVRAIFIVLQALEEKIQLIQASHRVGPVLFSTDPLKLALVLEAQNWKESYGKYVLLPHLTLS